VPDDPEEGLPDEAVVVRGGVMNPKDLEVSAHSHFDEFGAYALSVHSRAEMSADEISAFAGIPHGKIRETTVGALRGAGYSVVPSEQHGPAHADLQLPYPPSSSDWQALDDAFSEPRPNPTRRSR
jgi:hypothetical protein